MDASDINYVELITNVINEIFNNFFISIDNSIYSVLDDITFIDSTILSDNKIVKIFGSSNANSIVLISLSILIGFILYYSLKLFFSYFFSNSQVQRPLPFFIKAIIIGLLINYSYFICNQVLELNSNISLAIRNVGEYYLNKSICFSELINYLNSLLNFNNSNLNLFSLDGIIKSIASIGLFNLIFSYSLRFVMIKVLALVTPFSILSLLLDSTSWLFKSWLKAFISLILLQSFISIILLVIFSLDFGSNIFSKIIYIGSIYSLIKANTFMRELFGGISTDVSMNISNFRNLFSR